jgi:hypothetical protein
LDGNRSIITIRITENAQRKNNALILGLEEKENGGYFSKVEVVKHFQRK